LAVMKDVTGEAEFPGDFRNGFIDFGWYVCKTMLLSDYCEMIIVRLQ
jgi:hypothetical protein